LARQCFVNEYVFSLAADEVREGAELRDRLDHALASGAAIAPLWVAAGASYFPLGTLAQADRLPARTWSDAVDQLVPQQIREPRLARELRAVMPRLTDIADNVSRNVREMYEENPYPRWIKTAPTESQKPLGVFLHNHFPAVPQNVERKPSLDILLAGCGT